MHIRLALRQFAGSVDMSITTDTPNDAEAREVERRWLRALHWQLMDHPRYDHVHFGNVDDGILSARFTDVDFRKFDDHLMAQLSVHNTVQIQNLTHARASIRDRIYGSPQWHTCIEFDINLGWFDYSRTGLALWILRLARDFARA